MLNWIEYIDVCMCSIRISGLLKMTSFIAARKKEELQHYEKETITLILLLFRISLTAQ